MAAVTRPDTRRVPLAPLSQGERYALAVELIEAISALAYNRGTQAGRGRKAQLGALTDTQAEITDILICDVLRGAARPPRRRPKHRKTHRWLFLQRSAPPLA